MQKNNFYVITGGPGVGKTTLIDALYNHGFSVVPEDARQIIQEQIASDGNALPWKNKQRYAEMMLSRSVQRFNKMVQAHHDAPVFFDRGVIDAVCYMEMENMSISQDVVDSVRHCQYHKTVFILPAWHEIYQTDSERKQTWEEALYTFEKMKATYLAYGYEVIELPKASVEERLQLILDKVK